jgi:hypothetical protein
MKVHVLYLIPQNSCHTKQTAKKAAKKALAPRLGLYPYRVPSTVQAAPSMIWPISKQNSGLDGGTVISKVSSGRGKAKGVAVGRRLKDKSKQWLKATGVS